MSYDYKNRILLLLFKKNSMLKKICLFFVSVLIFWGIWLNSFTEARSYRSSVNDVHVNGYLKKNWTYVQPYYRTSPNSTKLDNYSCIDYGNCWSETSSYTSTPNYTMPSAIYTQPIMTQIQTCQNQYWMNSTIGSTSTTCNCKKWYTRSSDWSYCEIKTTYNTCIDKNSYLSTDDNCYCNNWYIRDENSNKCISLDNSCKNTYGNNSISKSDGLCYCAKWYTWSFDKTYCELQTTYNSCTDTVNSYLASDGFCYCNNWYIWDPDLKSCVTKSSWSNVSKKTDINLANQYCEETYWTNFISDTKDGCKCANGFVLSKDWVSCIKKIIKKTLKKK